MEQEKPKIYWIILGILLALLIAGFFYYYFKVYAPAKRAREQANQNSNTGGVSAACQNLDVSSWKTYSPGYSIKYPADWQYAAISYSQPPGENADVSPPPWTVSFAPKNQNAVVWLGEVARTLEDFKKILESSSPAFEVIKEEKTKIVDREATKLTLSGGGVSYQTLVYYVSSGNVLPVFKGPAQDAQFKNCEPQIFQKMLESYQFAKWPGEGSEGGMPTDQSGSSGSDSSGLTQCTTALYNTDEASCTSQAEEKICGSGRYVYDNGQTQNHDNEYRNPCEYCSAFDQNGFMELRGTKIYATGYKLGACK
jgi:hypothetical protein